MKYNIILLTILTTLFALPTTGKDLAFFRQEALALERKIQDQKNPSHELRDLYTLKKEIYIGEFLKQKFDAMKMPQNKRDEGLKEYLKWESAAKKLLYAKDSWTPKNLEKRFWAFDAFAKIIKDLRKEKTTRHLSFPIPNLRLLFAASKIGLYSLTPSYIKKRTPWSKKGNTPLTRYFAELMSSLADLNSYQITIENQNFIPQQHQKRKDDKLLTIITPNHTSAMGDSYAWAKSSPKSHILFAKSKTLSPMNFMNKKFAQSDEIIAIGSGNVPAIQQVFTALKHKRGTVFWNFPQGFVTESLGGPIIGANKNFEKKLILELMDKGYKVQVIPTVIKMMPTFFSTPKQLKSSAYKKIHLKFLPPLSPSFVEELSRQEVLGNYLRDLWIDHAQKELTLQEMEERIESYLGM